MKRLVLAAWLVSCSAFLGCKVQGSVDLHADPEPSSTAEAKTNVESKTSATKLGEAITEKNTTSLDALLKEPAKWNDKTVRTEGKITAVCQAMGCWMELGDDNGLAHVKMAGHSFFIPKDASGRHAVIQGKVLHDEKDDCTEEAAKATGKTAKIEIEATGVELVD